MPRKLLINPSKLIYFLCIANVFCALAVSLRFEDLARALQFTTPQAVSGIAKGLCARPKQLSPNAACPFIQGNEVQNGVGAIELRRNVKMLGKHMFG